MINPSAKEIFMKQSQDENAWQQFLIYVPNKQLNSNFLKINKNRFSEMIVNKVQACYNNKLLLIIRNDGITKKH